jgi:hypothetical protein
VEVEPRAVTRERALRWSANLPRWFPSLRPQAPEGLAFAAEVAARLGPNDGEIPAPLVERGVALLGEEGSARLVERFAEAHGDRWHAVCADSGDAPAVERALAAAAVRAAIFERRLPPPERLSDLESGRAPARAPREVLVVTLFAETIWSIVDVQEAEAAAAAADDWLRGALAFAAARRGTQEVRRVQTLAAVVRPQLPLVDHPRASELLDDAYERAEADEELAAEVADALLPLYVAVRARASFASRT